MEDEDGGFGLGSSAFFSGIISHSIDGCTRGEEGTSGVHSIPNSIADFISTFLCKILLIGVDSGELNRQFHHKPRPEPKYKCSYHIYLFNQNQRMMIIQIVDAPLAELLSKVDCTF